MNYRAGEQANESGSETAPGASSESAFLRIVPLLFRYGVLASGVLAARTVTEMPAVIWIVLSIACLFAVSYAIKKDPAAALVLLIVVSCSATYRAVPALAIGGIPVSIVDIILIYLGIRLILVTSWPRKHDRGPFVALLIVMVYATVVGLMIGNDRAMVFRHLHDVLPFALIPLNLRLGHRDYDLLRIEAAIIVAGIAAAGLEIYLYLTMLSVFSLNDFRQAGVYQFVIALAAAFLLHWQLNREVFGTLAGHAAAIACQCVFAAGMFVSGTRNAMLLHVAVLVLVLAASAIVRGRIQMGLAGVLIFGMCSFLILTRVLSTSSGELGPAIERFTTLADPMRQDDTFALRIRTTIEAGSETLKQSPILGLGFGRILVAYGSLSYGVGDNVEIAPGWWFWTAGLVGLCVWLYFSIVIPLTMFGRARRIRDSRHRLTAFVWTLACVAFVIITSLTFLITVQGGILTSAFLSVDWSEGGEIAPVRDTVADAPGDLIEG